MHGNSLTVVVTPPAGCHGLLLLLHHPRHLQHLGLALRCLLCHLCHLYFFSFLVLALVPFFPPCFYSLRHFIYSLIFSSAPSLSAHRFLSSSILSFLSLARPFQCLSFKCFLSWSSISALSGVERSIGVFFILLSLLDNCLAIPFLPP